MSGLQSEGGRSGGTETGGEPQSEAVRKQQAGREGALLALEVVQGGERVVLAGEGYQFRIFPVPDGRQSGWYEEPKDSKSEPALSHRRVISLIGTGEGLPADRIERIEDVVVAVIPNGMCVELLKSDTLRREPVSTTMAAD